MLKNIQSQGCNIAPVGHYDGKNNDIQWRISFPGEQSVILDLYDVQILCYALIKTILRETLNTSQREVVSSFQIKHVMFWCVELCACHWVDSYYINCLNICLTKLIQMIKARNIPHYIIESRNLLNSKMTENMSTKLLTSKQIRIITKLQNSEQSYKGKVKTHKYINRQNQSTTGKL